MHHQNHGIQVVSSKIEINKYLEQAQPKLKLVSDCRIEGNIIFAMKSLGEKYQLLDPQLKYPDNSDVIQDEYTISIEWNQEGRKYPAVKEVGNRIIDSFAVLSKKIPSIKDITDLHLYEDDSTLCLCTNTEYDVRYPDGILIRDLIEDLIIPFLYYQSYLNIHFKEPYPGRGHGALGLLEYLSENRTNPKAIDITISSLQNYFPQMWEIINKKKPSSSRHCICGSSIIGKKCHRSAIIGAKLVYLRMQ